MMFLLISFHISIHKKHITSQFNQMAKRQQIMQMQMQIIENYRPIAKLCSTSKFFERLILQRIHTIELDNNIDLTGKQQHGFKKSKNPTFALQLQRTQSWAASPQPDGICSLTSTETLREQPPKNSYFFNHAVLVLKIYNYQSPNLKSVDRPPFQANF